MKNIAMYLRLSIPDVDMGECGKNESNSIENQRLLIRNYLTVHPEITGDVIEYKDDGFSGLNFNRPAFRQMIEDAKRGYIGTIVVKDLSRFGRDYIGVGDYIEQILPSLGVRLIAINSRYDSKDQGANIVSLDVSISNMINNMYSRDISKKLRSSYRARWKNGDNTSRTVPYGYTTDKNDPTRTPIIDEEAADVVRNIFMLAVGGLNTKEIAELLNSRGIMTPLAYKNKHSGYKMTVAVCAESEQLWTTNMVANIIKRYDYTGARTHGVNEIIGVGLGKTQRRDKHEWIVVENNHEPIVSKKIYDRAQKAIKSTGYRKLCHNRNQELLASRVRCGCCNHKMSITNDGKIFCHYAISVGSKSNCSREFYDVINIENAVLSSLKMHLDLMSELSSTLKEKSHIITDNKAAVKAIRAKIEKMNDEFVLQYENYVNGNLKRDGFIAIKGEITSKRAQLEAQIKEIEEDIEGRERIMFDVDRVVGLGKTINYFSDVTKPVLDALVDEIKINDLGDVEIRFKYEDLFKEASRIL